MSDDPFPGSSADFYERIQVLKESAKYDAFLREKYRQLITELADALEEEYGSSNLLKRAREATK